MSVPCVVCRTMRTRRLFQKGGKDFLRCTRCGLVRIDPLPIPHQLASYYERTYDSGIYAPYAAAEDVRRCIAAHRFRAIRAFARPGRWLDVGCGTGQFIDAARQAGMNAEGLDIAPGAVARARAQGLTAHVGRVEDFEPTARYDTITAFDVIEHTTDPAAFLDRVCRWLVPEGTLVLTLPNVTSIYPRLLMRRYWFYYAPNDHLYYFSPQTIARLLTQCGFAVRSVERAYKPLTLEHVISQLQIFNPLLGRAARVIAAPLSRSVRTRARQCYLGEMMVVAARQAAGAERQNGPPPTRSEELGT